MQMYQNMTMISEDKSERIGEFLIRYGAITPLQLTQALRKQKQTGGRLGQTLISLEYTDQKQILQALTQMRVLKRSQNESPRAAGITSSELAVSRETHHWKRPLGLMLISVLIVAAFFAYLVPIFWSTTEASCSFSGNCGVASKRAITAVAMPTVDSSMRIDEQPTVLPAPSKDINKISQLTVGNPFTAPGSRQDSYYEPTDSAAAVGEHAVGDSVGKDSLTTVATITPQSEVLFGDVVNPSLQANGSGRQILGARWSDKGNELHIVLELDSSVRGKIKRSYLADQHMQFRFVDTHAPQFAADVFTGNAWMSDFGFSQEGNDAMWRFRLNEPGSVKYHELAAQDDASSYRLVLIIRK